MKKINEMVKETADGFVLVWKKNYRAAFGFGEKFDSVNQRGKLVRACVREKCFYQGEYTYLSMPFCMTPDGFGLYVDTYVEVDFDLRLDGEIKIKFPRGSRGEKADVWLFEGTPKEILRQFRSLVGYPRVFPKWVLGSWMSSNRWKRQSELEEQLRFTKEYGFPHSVMVVEPWSDLTTRYLWNGASCPEKAGDEYPSYSELDFSSSEYWQNPQKTVEEIHAEGIRLLLWVVPIYAQGNNLETDCNIEQCLKDNQYVKEHNECVRNRDGTPYEIPHTWCVGSMVPDFTDSVATEHWFNRFRYLKEEIGIDGFKTDGGEFIHDSTVTFADGTTGLEGQNRYCELYTRAFADFMGENGVVFSRAGGQTSPAYSVIWAGDQESTWREFASVLKAGLSAGISGVNCWGFDIAGFSGYLPSEELYLRAVQMAAFVPVMQWHSDPVSNGRCDFTGAWEINDRSPWNIAAFHKNPELLEVLRNQFRLHYNLIPYQYNLMLDAAKTGVPAMRHLMLEFPRDEVCYDIDDEFMLGEAFLVAPILEDYVKTRKVYLPAGEWFDLYTGESKAGGWYEIPLCRQHIPVYMRKNTCVALNLSDKKLCSDVGNILTEYKKLTFLVSGCGEYTFKDDLGNEIFLEWTRKSHSIKQSNKIEINIFHIENGSL